MLYVSELLFIEAESILFLQHGDSAQSGQGLTVAGDYIKLGFNF